MTVLFSPLGMALIAVLLDVLASRHVPRWGHWLLRSVLFVCLVLMTPFGANRLVAWIEAQVPEGQACLPSAHPSEIVLLSGGFSRPPQDAGDESALTVSSLRRLGDAVKLLGAHPDVPLIISGGGPYEVKEADVLARQAVRMGVSEALIRKEVASASTVESASYLARQGLSRSERVWLVTSALHMPRAMMAFKQFGIQACAAPSYSSYLPPGHSLGYYLPQSSSLVKSEEALHEFVGLIVYRWRARSSDTPSQP